LVEEAELETPMPQLHKEVELAISAAVERTLHQESLLLVAVAVAVALGPPEMVERLMVEMELLLRKTD